MALGALATAATFVLVLINQKGTQKQIDSLYGAQNETYIEGWEKKTSNLLIYKRLCNV